MKQLLLFALLAGMAVAGKGQRAQFHVKVTCNPGNGGEVNPKWLNNYIVVYTVDNWTHSHSINDQLTWVGYRDDGTDYYSSSYEPPSFQTMQEAASYAERFTSSDYVGKYEAAAYSKHLRLTKAWQLENIRHPVRSAKPKNAQCSERIIR